MSESKPGKLKPYNKCTKSELIDHLRIRDLQLGEEKANVKSYTIALDKAQEELEDAIVARENLLIEKTQMGVDQAAELHKVSTDCGEAAGFVNNVLDRLIGLVAEEKLNRGVFEEVSMKLHIAISLMHRDSTSTYVKRLIDTMEKAKAAAEGTPMKKSISVGEPKPIILHLEKVGKKKIDVIRLIRNYMGLGLQEAKVLAEDCTNFGKSIEVYSHVDLREIVKVATEFQEVGAKVYYK